MNYVLDTNVLVAGIRSSGGASAEILRRILARRTSVLCSVPLFLEYESVLLRPEHLAAAGVKSRDIVNFLDVLADMVRPVEIQFLWRPRLRDPDDDMVLEAAVNGQSLGDDVTIVSFNRRDFLPHALDFGVAVQTPAQFFQGARHGNP